MQISKAKIKKIMVDNGIYTFESLANFIGISKNQLSRMLSSNFNPVKSCVRRLCETLKVKEEDIMTVLNNTPSTNFEDRKPRFTNIELFAGGGGLALGLDLAGFNTLELVEFDKDCCETLKSNRPNWNVVCGDIHTISFEKLKDKVDLVSGGFPCQAFSYAGKKMGFEDTRGTLFHEFARCVAEVHPKMLLAENVKGLVSHDKGRTLKVILKVFSSLGYKVQFKVLNSVNYGVAEKRERIFVVGIRKDIENVSFSYPVPEKTIKTLRDVLLDCPKSAGIKYSERKKRILDLVPPGGCWVELPTEVAKAYMGKSYFSGGGKRGVARRMSWDEPCLTLTCSPSQKQTDRCHPDETRPFTVRECARIQAFPDNWVFCGNIYSQYRQIGNAVPVELARRVGLQIIKCLLDMKN